MIYLAKVVGQPIYKIGFSNKPKLRYKNLSQANPFYLEPVIERNGSMALEQDVHRACAPYRIKGEWFHECPEVVAAFCKAYDRYPEIKATDTLGRHRERERHAAMLAFGEDLTSHQRWCAEVVMNRWIKETWPDAV